MSESDSVTVYVVKIDKTLITGVEEWIIVAQKTVVHTGSWMNDVESFVQGFIQGLEAANIRTSTQVMEIRNDEAYYKVQKGDIDLKYLESLLV